MRCPTVLMGLGSKPANFQLNLATPQKVSVRKKKLFLEPACSFSMEDTGSLCDSGKLCWGAKATQRLWDDSAADWAMIWGCYWIWLRVSFTMRNGSQQSDSLLFWVWGANYIHYCEELWFDIKSLPKSLLMLGFNKVFSVWSRSCSLGLFIIPLDRRSEVELREVPLSLCAAPGASAKTFLFQVIFG